MAGKHESPLWNQDAVVAGGLAFAGMAVLQSKLVPALVGDKLAALGSTLDWRVIQWWPVLLVLGGVILWYRWQVQQRREEAQIIRANGEVEDEYRRERQA